MPVTIIEGIRPEERKELLTSGSRRRGDQLSTTVAVARELKLLRERRAGRGRRVRSN